MNFKDLLDVADYNKSVAKHEASIKMYSSDLAPPKKLPKSGVHSDGVKRFLAKKKAEEEAKLNKAREEKEKLLALRAQNSKNNKKAKIMASRTKDNDFSKIKLTEDEIESKKKIEQQLQRKHLEDKVERMKARIEMEEYEKLLPRKRKRKSKPNASGAIDEPCDIDISPDDPKDSGNNSLKSQNKNKVRKVPRPPPPQMSFSDLLKVAEVKQHERPVLLVLKKQEEKLMTRKERRLMEQEQDRLQRKAERLERGETAYKCLSPSKHSAVGDKKSQSLEKSNVKKPMVIHAEKYPVPQPRDQSQKFKIPKGTANSERVNVVSKTVNKGSRPVETNPNKNSSVSRQPTNHNRGPSQQNNKETERIHTKHNMKDETRITSKSIVTKKHIPNKNGMRVTPVTSAEPVKEAPAAMPFDADALAAMIAKKVKEDIEKEMDAKYAAKYANKYAMMQNATATVKSVPTKAPEKQIQVLAKPKLSTGSVGEVSKLSKQQYLMSKKGPEKIPNPKAMVTAPKRPAPPPLPPSVTKPFHPNPYLDPPRRRLEPLRPQKPPPKRRIESDDDDDDDMSDFIDDGPATQNDEDYSKYIKEIFGYDRNKYLDDDADDIIESSFAEQMKEETHSTKLGILEDLEEERKEKLREKEKKLKKKLKS